LMLGHVYHGELSLKGGQLKGCSLLYFFYTGYILEKKLLSDNFIFI